MRAYAHVTALALLTLATLSGCDQPDVGQRCVLAWNPDWEAEGTPPPPTPATAGADFFETGNLACDDLVCIVSPGEATTKYGQCVGDACGYCSKPCVSDRDCFSSKTGLKCEQVVLDPVFMASLDEQTRQRYLGDIQTNNYCVTPR